MLKLVAENFDDKLDYRSLRLSHYKLLICNKEKNDNFATEKYQRLCLKLEVKVIITTFLMFFLL